MKDKINRLKKEKNAVILAHYYAPAEVQEIADFVGDSFYLAKAAKKCEADVIVFCGVSFMGESARILSPDKKVLMPDVTADCPMAHMVAEGKIAEMRAKYEDLAVVCYINSTAALKCQSDVCVTSSNAVQIVRSLPNRNIFFIPDRNLGRYVAEQVPEKNVILNDGCCPVHAKITATQVLAEKEKHPAALVLTHPECEAEVLAVSDAIGSTADIIKYASGSPVEEFIICTEDGVDYQLQTENPGKRFYYPSPCPRCMDMKRNTLENLLHVLETGEDEIEVPEEIRMKALVPLDRMLEMGKAQANSPLVGALPSSAKREPNTDGRHCRLKTDILIVGCGAGGLYTALHLPEDKQITIVTKDKAERSDSFLAQGGICVLHDPEDYDSFYEDTMRAGHYENKAESVDIMIRSSREVIDTLVSYGVDFEKNGSEFAYTREGAHSRPRILYHQDETGKEITSHLLAAVRERQNITLVEEYTMVDLLCEDNTCCGIVGKDKTGSYSAITADYTVLATGGIGGLFAHSTNYRHLTGDAIALALRYNIRLKNIDYIQIHPTTLYSQKSGREFLISESVRGEGALLYNHKGERFVNELLPRDVVANAIFAEMKKEGTEHVWLSLEKIDEHDIKTHFPHIYGHCLAEGYDITKEPIPVVPSQHYFMGGIDVDSNSKTSMDRLYAVGETACNGVHGRNRLASNSLLETLVFAARAAGHLLSAYTPAEPVRQPVIDEDRYRDWENENKKAVLAAIEREKEKTNNG